MSNYNFFSYLLKGFSNFLKRCQSKFVTVTNPKNRRDRYAKSLGFTLIEVLVVMIIVGILSAIVAPSWLAFANNQRLNSAQSLSFSNLRLAQSNAKRTQTIWQASFRNTINVAQYAVHPEPPKNATKQDRDRLPWKNFDEGVRIVDKTEKEPRTTFAIFQVVPSEPLEPVYRVQFKPQGSVNGQLGKITFVTRNGDRKKCVIVSTLLGAMRTAENSGCN